MIYRITIDDINIYGETEETTLINPKVDIELNAAGSCSFTMPLYHQYYDLPQLLTSEVKVFEDNQMIFFGRIAEIKTTFNKQKEIYCEGALAYLNDSIQRPKEFKEVLLHDFFRELIANHNDQVAANRRFNIGNITIPDKYVYRELNFENTFDAINNMCLDTDGGYIFTRQVDGRIYIDWLKNMPYTADQPVEYALNLIDMSQDVSAADICTVVIPVGTYEAKDDEVDPPKYLTVETITGGYDYIENEEGKNLYGRVAKVKEYSDIKEAQKLYDTAALWLQDEQYDKLVIECEAAELHYIDNSYQAFKVGQTVRVKSTPHLIDKDLPLTKMSLGLDSGIKRITIGTPPRKTLTEIKAPATSSVSTGGGSGSGGGSQEEDPTINIQQIEDSWETIVANRGTKYDIGNFKLLETSDPIVGTVRMQKVARKESDSESTWLAMNLSAATIPHWVNPGGLNNGEVCKAENAIQWETSHIREYLNNTFFDTLPECLKNGIVSVKKYSQHFIGDQQSRNYITRDKIWIPSWKEFFGDPALAETVGTHYSLSLGENMPFFKTYNSSDGDMHLRTKAPNKETNYGGQRCWFYYPRRSHGSGWSYQAEQPVGYKKTKAVATGTDVFADAATSLYILIGFCL